METLERRERAVPPELPEGEVALPKRRDEEEHELVSPEHPSEISVCGES